jgi:predicted porin
MSLLFPDAAYAAVPSGSVCGSGFFSPQAPLFLCRKLVIRNKAVFAACMVLALLIADPAGAQTQQPLRDLPYLLPSGVRCTVTPGFDWRLQYEDNVANAVRNEVSDWSNRYRPSLDVSLAGPLFSMSGSTTLDVIEYIDERYLNAVDQDHGLEITVDLNERMRFFGSGAYTVSTDPDRFFEVEEISGIGDFAVTRTKQKTKTGSLGITYALAPRSELTAMFMWSNFETSSTSGSDVYNAQAQYLYRLAPRTALRLTGNYSKFDFAFDDTLSARDRERFEDLIGSGDLQLLFGSKYKTETYTVSAGFDHSVSRDLRLSASLGWRYTETDSTSENEDVETGELVRSRRRSSGDGITGDLTLAKEFGRTRLRLSANHNVGTNPDSGESYEATRVLCAVNHDFNGRLRGNLTFQYRHNESDASDEFPSVTDRDIYSVSALLSYDWRRWLGFSLGYTFSRNENKIVDRRTDRNTVYSMISLKPLRPMVIW